MEQVSERESVQRQLLALRPADPLVHAARARLLRQQGNSEALEAREKALSLFQSIIEEPGATEPLAGVFAEFLADTSPWWTPLHLRSARSSSAGGAEVEDRRTLRHPGESREKETYTVVAEAGMTRVTMMIVHAVQDGSRLGSGADQSPVTMHLTGVALRARPFADKRRRGKSPAG